jgi:hypothetical protein
VVTFTVSQKCPHTEGLASLRFQFCQSTRFRRVRRLKNRDNVIWNIESFGFVESSLVKLNNRNITKVSREQLQEVLKTISIEVGEFIEKAVST